MVNLDDSIFLECCQRLSNLDEEVGLRVAARCWLGQLDILGFPMFIFDANDDHRYRGKYHVQSFII